MKKFLILIAVVLAVNLTGCQSFRNQFQYFAGANPAAINYPITKIVELDHNNNPIAEFYPVAGTVVPNDADDSVTFKDSGNGMTVTLTSSYRIVK